MFEGNPRNPGFSISQEFQEGKNNEVGIEEEMYARRQKKYTFKIKISEFVSRI